MADTAIACGDRPSRHVLFAGECMVEEIVDGTEVVSVGIGGDTYNAAVYCRRVADELGVPLEVKYLSGLSDSVESHDMEAAWRRDGIRPVVVSVPKRTVGRYRIVVDDRGERSFQYDRKSSAAAAVFASGDWIPSLQAETVYLSGITLQLLQGSPDVFLELLRHLRRLRAEGSLIAFDVNFRRAAWADRARAREWIGAATTASDIVFTSREDEADLWGESSDESVIARLRALGAKQVVVKLGAEGALLLDGLRSVTRIEAVPVAALDTTAAGDSLAGAYVAGREAGLTPADALRLGARVAATVVRFRGALAPSSVPLTEP